MIASAFDEDNMVLEPPKGMTQDQVEMLSACLAQVNGFDAVITCWKPDPVEWEEMRRTGRVWLIVMGSTMQPVIVTGNSPFKR